MNKLANHDFRSDTTQPCHPKIFEFMQKHCARPHTSYGNGDLNQELNAKISDIFGKKCTTYGVYSGTAANCLALSAMTKPYGAVLTPEFGHLAVDENSGLELFSGGARVMTIPTPSGKLTPNDIDNYLAHYHFGFVHSVQPQSLTISNLNEQGLAYTNKELQAISAKCQEYKLNFHIDGARYANALLANNQNSKELLNGVNLDALTLGFSKNGAFGCEILVLFNENFQESLPYNVKRGGHMPAKGEYIAAQALALLDNDLWLENAKNANDLCQEFAKFCQNHPKIKILSGGIGNEIFIQIPKNLAQKALDSGFSFYEWSSLDDKKYVADVYRFVFSWHHKVKDLHELIAVLS